MSGKKQRLAHTLEQLGALELLWRIGGRQRDCLLIFNYHRVGADRLAAPVLFEENVYDSVASDFAAQVRWLKGHLPLLDLEQLTACLQGRRALAGPAAMITFDDAYRDNYELAYPILRALEAPATLFVPTGLIEDRTIGWWDQIAYLLKQTRVSRLQLDGQQFHLPVQRRLAATHLQERMKAEPASQTADLVARLAAACQVDLPDPALQDRELMTWDQIREVADGPFSIGSHAHTHRVLATLEPAEQRQELTRSKQILERQLSRPISAVAYPVGEQRYLSPITPDLARGCGYTLGFTYLTGLARWGEIDPLLINRLEGPPSKAMLAASATMPGLFSWRPPRLWPRSHRQIAGSATGPQLGSPRAPEPPSSLSASSSSKKVGS